MGLVRDSARYYAMELLTCDNEGDGGDVDGGCCRLYFHPTILIMPWGIRAKYHITGLHSARNKDVRHYYVPIEY